MHPIDSGPHLPPVASASDEGTANGSPASNLRDALASLPVADALAHWHRFVWWNGVRPLFHWLIENDVTLAEAMALKALAQRPLTVAGVADCLCTTPSAASRAVDRLVREGLVDRAEDPADRRQKRLTLTPMGRERVTAIDRAFGGTIAGLAERIAPADREALPSLLAHLMATHVATARDVDEGHLWARELLASVRSDEGERR